MFSQKILSQIKSQPFQVYIREKKNKTWRRLITLALFDVILKREKIHETRDKMCVYISFDLRQCELNIVVFITLLSRQTPFILHFACNFSVFFSVQQHPHFGWFQESSIWIEITQRCHNNESTWKWPHITWASVFFFLISLCSLVGCTAWIFLFGGFVKINY